MNMLGVGLFVLAGRVGGGLMMYFDRLRGRG